MLFDGSIVIALEYLMGFECIQQHVLCHCSRVLWFFSGGN